MSAAADDYCFLKADQGLVICAECGERGEEVGTLRLCLRCDAFENPDTVGSIRAVLRRLPEAHPLREEFEVEGLAELDVEGLAVAIWDDIAEEELRSKRRLA